MAARVLWEKAAGALSDGKTCRGIANLPSRGNLPTEGGEVWLCSCSLIPFSSQRWFLKRDHMCGGIIISKANCIFSSEKVP